MSALAVSEPRIDYPLCVDITLPQILLYFYNSDMVNVFDQVHACRAAAVPACSVSTVELKDLRRGLCQYAVTNGRDKTGVAPIVMEWRLVDGIREVSIMRKTAGGNETVVTEANDLLELQGTSITYSDGPHAPSKGQEGSTIPYAVEFIREYPTWVRRHKNIPQSETAPGLILLLRDWHNWVAHNKFLVDLQLQAFEDIAQEGRDIIVLMVTPDTIDIPAEIGEWVDSSELLLPNQQARIESIRKMKNQLSEKRPGKFPLVEAMTDDEIETVASAAGGLSSVGIDNLLCKSLALTRSFDTNYISADKAKKVRAMGYELLNTNFTMDNVGGLDVLKEEIMLMKPRFTQAANAYGFRRKPTGVLLAGVPGTGKTLSAKAIGNELGIPVLVVDPSTLKDQYVGGTEKNMKRLFQTLEAAAPIAVMFDEAEKMVGKQDRVSDGGAHSAMLGQLLTFMSEKASDLGVFFIFTANDMSKFPVELVRRFDLRMFVDLPAPAEREAIFRLKMEENNRNPDDDNVDLTELVRQTNEYSGSDIEQVIEKAMSYAFRDGQREPTTDDYLTAIDKTVPTAKTYADQIAEMQKWVRDKTMVPANSVSISLEEDAENDSIRDVL